MAKYHQIENVMVRHGKLSFTVDGKDHTADLAEHSKKLAAADEAVQENFRVSPSGYGIHWPDIDEDLSVDALIGVKHSPAGR